MLYSETALRGVLLFIFLWFAFWGGVYTGRAGWNIKMVEKITP